VAAAVLRVFGPQLAEVPLVATRHSARRQGHARVLMRAIEVRAPPARRRPPRALPPARRAAGPCARVPAPAARRAASAPWE